MDGPRRSELQELMTRLADGEREAFTPVFAALWPVLRAFCRRTLADAAEADDVAQQALLDVFARAAEFDRERDALVWALGIAAWGCRSARRRAGRRREDPLPGEGALVDRAPTAEEAVAGRQLAEAAAALLGELRAEDREAILAAIGEGARPPVAPATFRKRLERALGRLRTAWRSRHGVP